MKKLALFLLAVRCLLAQSSPCALSGDATVSAADVQLAINQALGLQPCTTANLANDGCTVVDVQRVINAALGGTCVVTGNPGNGGNSGDAVTDSLTVFEADGVTQTGRPIVIGRAFAQGEFPSGQCAQPVIGGTPVTTWQNDIKNSWPDGSIKFAVVSFIAPILSANSSLAVTLQSVASSSACNGRGGLSKSQMVNYNSGGGSGSWDAQLVVTDPTGAAVKTVDAKAMVNALSTGDCLFQTWLAGPVVTQAIVEDCTPTSAYDFGAHWDGTTMNLNSGAWYTGNNQYASLHPRFLLSFFSTANYPVQCDFILENMWTGRMQDQRYSFVLKTGATPTQVYTSHAQAYANSSGIFTQLGATRWMKTFWSGTAPGHIRIDHNFAYLESTKLMLNYDLVNASVSPDSTTTLSHSSFSNSLASEYGCPSNSGGDYSCYTQDDHGDITGHAMIAKAMNGGNDKGKPVSREELEYLYNMGSPSCGSPNSACAKAWALLSGEVDANASTTLLGVTGGGGMWEAFAQWPFHQRESRTGGSFYCPGYDTPDTTLSSSCGSGVGNTVGHSISRHVYYTNDQLSYGYLVSPVGNLSFTTVGYSFDTTCAHWVDFSYPHYLLTGSYFAMEEVQQGANYCDFAQNPGTNIYYGVNGFFVSLTFLGGARTMSWGLQQNILAATASPDGTAEQSYYNAVIRSNAEIMEGFYGITGTALTPTSPNTTCNGYSPYGATPSTATRWDFGHCGRGLGISPALHNPDSGFCWGAEVYIPQYQVTAATNANPSELTMTPLPITGSSYANLFTGENVFGATGSWTVLNQSRNTPTQIDSGHLTISCPGCVGLSQPLTGTVYMTPGEVDQSQASDFQEPWMDWGLGIVLNRGVELGFTALTNFTAQVNLFLLELLQDPSSNPYLIYLYESPTKLGSASNSTGGTSAPTTNPYVNTWAAFKSALVPASQTISTFNNSGMCSSDHPYPLSARAAGSFLPGIVDSSDGNITGSNAWSWLFHQVPFYTLGVSGGSSCSAGNDIQAPLALAPR